MTENITIDGGARRCSIFLTPARDDYSLLDGMIRDFCNRFDLSPFVPHVTVYTGAFSDLSTVERAVCVAIEGVPPLTLRVSGIGFSAEYFKTLFIEFEEEPLLRLIHERIKDECGVLSAYELHPHLSLLYADLPLPNKESLAKRVVLSRTEFSFDLVKLVTPGNPNNGWRDTKRWETLLDLELTGKSPETI